MVRCREFKCLECSPSVFIFVYLCTTSLRLSSLSLSLRCVGRVAFFSVCDIRRGWECERCAASPPHHHHPTHTHTHTHTHTLGQKQTNTAWQILDMSICSVTGAQERACARTCVCACVGFCVLNESTISRKQRRKIMLTVGCVTLYV